MNDITVQEQQEFNEYVAPRLNALANDSLSFDAWNTHINGMFDDVSSFDLLIESFGWLDIIFLLLGISTAYRLVENKPTTL